ncbi:MAG TPA: hypothetical protein VGF94_26545 [Kofleriaceae bacterium]
MTFATPSTRGIDEPTDGRSIGALHYHAMRSRTLGVDGPVVTCVGCGEVSLARAAARGIAARDVEAALGEAIERGVTIVEVADEEAAQRLVGETVRSLRARDRVVVACHVPAQLKLAKPVEAALRALRLEPPGLWLLDGELPPEVAGAARDLEHAGKIPAALEFYRVIVARFRNTEQGRVAAERIRALAK